MIELVGDFNSDKLTIKNGTVTLGDLLTFPKTKVIEVHGGTLVADCQSILCPVLELEKLILNGGKVKP